jgi:uncharacterized protein YbaR (Trm112 family)
MTDLITYHCPLDPNRDAVLERDQQRLVCSRCKVWFPVRLGIPTLLVREAELPDGLVEISQLPCQKKQR